MKKDNNIDTRSLAHTKWDCKYHIVFAPKYTKRNTVKLHIFRFTARIPLDISTMDFYNQKSEYIVELGGFAIMTGTNLEKCHKESIFVKQKELANGVAAVWLT